MTLRDKMLAVMADVNNDVAEREELVELIAIALLTRKNLFILGDPGQAKSCSAVWICPVCCPALCLRLYWKQMISMSISGSISSVC